MHGWFESKEKREKESLENHARLSKLFREDRLSFERERKRMIDAVIESSGSEEQRERLRYFQASWDKRMKGAGNPHNRLVLAQAFFWEHFHEVWHPNIKALNDTLNHQADRPPSWRRFPDPTDS